MGKAIRKDEMGNEPKLIVSFDDLTEELSIDGIEEEQMLELQLTMATTSINHEYARIEFDDSDCYERREELLGYMAECRGKYLDARTRLANYNPIALETFEKDLILQKLTTITHYHA